MDATGVLRGVDVSHHQERLDVGRLPVDYVIARTAQAAGGRYGTTRDRAYTKHKANAIRGGKLFCSYLYLGNAISAAANVALHASIEPDRNIPVMVDWEEGSGDGAYLRAVIAEFGKAGYRVVLTYAPKWYWQKVGHPKLDGLPPLVSSRYPDNNPAGYEDQYRKCPVSYWDGYGGNTVGVLQFSSSGRLQPYPNNNLDLLAFRGTRPQLAALFGGQTQEDDDMPSVEDVLNSKLIPNKVYGDAPDSLGSLVTWTNWEAHQANKQLAALNGTVGQLVQKLSELADLDEAELARQLAPVAEATINATLERILANVDTVNETEVAKAVFDEFRALLGRDQ